MSNFLITAWLVFLVVMFVRRRLIDEQVSRRAPGTWLGIVLQAIGFSAIWTLRRAVSSPISALGDWTSAVMGCASILLALASIWNLGRQWSVAGRILADHELVTSGPYHYMRHPIYTAMAGMLLATAVSLSSLLGVVAGFGAFAVGTLVRVHYEDRLLRQQFGTEFDQYAAQVPRFWPRISCIERAEMEKLLAKMRTLRPFRR